MVFWFYRALSRLPLPLLYGLSTLAAWCLQHLFRYRRAVVETNLSRAFPDATAEHIRRLRQQFYSNFCDAAVEIIAGYRLPQEAFADRVTIENPEVLHELSKHGTQSVLVMTLHQGNWEWMLHCARSEYPMDGAFVYKRLHSAGADKFSLAQRGRFGYQAIEMRDVARNVIKHRRTPRLIYMVADQSPGDRERNHWTTFLNQSTAFFSGGASLARATGFPVAFAGCQRIARGHYKITLHTVAEAPKSLEESDITERYARLAEASIREAPADWLWSNRRWKMTPPTRQAD